MERRKFMIGMGSVAAGSTALVGSGAFSTAEVERDVSFVPADDSNAYLALESCDGPNGEYVVEEDGEVHLDFTDSNPTSGGGEGVNEGSVYTFDNLLKITNQGTQEVEVWLTEHGATTFNLYWEDNPNNSAEEQGNAVTLKVGKSICVGASFSHDFGGNEFGTFTVYGEATD